MTARPTLRQQARSAMLAVAREAYERIVRSEPPIEARTKARRLATCQGCDQFQSEKMRCQKCGCFLEYKIRMRSQRCPSGKW